MIRADRLGPPPGGEFGNPLVPSPPPTSAPGSTPNHFVLVGTLALLSSHSPTFSPSLFQTTLQSNSPSLYVPSSPVKGFQVPLNLILSAEKLIHGVALLDSGASSCFIDKEYAHAHGIPLRKRKFPISLAVIDGRDIASGVVTLESEPITSIVDSLFQSCICFNVISCPAYPIVIGLSWLELHNPVVDWKQRKLLPPCSPLATEQTSPATFHPMPLSSSQDMLKSAIAPSNPESPESPAFPKYPENHKSAPLKNLCDMPKSDVAPADPESPVFPEFPKNREFVPVKNPIDMLKSAVISSVPESPASPVYPESVPVKNITQLSSLASAPINCCESLGSTVTLPPEIPLQTPSSLKAARTQVDHHMAFAIYITPAPRS
jgi:hypothetical protein